MLALIQLTPAPLTQYTTLGIPVCFRSTRAPPTGIVAWQNKAFRFPFQSFIPTLYAAVYLE